MFDPVWNGGAIIDDPEDIINYKTLRKQTAPPKTDKISSVAASSSTTCSSIQQTDCSSAFSFMIYSSLIY